MKFNVGDEGPEAIAIDAAREAGKERLIEPDRAPTEGLRDDASEEGRVGARTGGCCRMRLSPDAPKPCSCSVMTGVLKDGSVSHLVSYVVQPQAPDTRRRYDQGVFAANKIAATED